MQEYRSYANLDDRILNDGDVGFAGFNNRLRPDQLQGGMLVDSQNIRLDRNGEAQVRKGIEVIEAPFAVGGTVLRLPTDAELDNGSTAMLPTTIESATLDGTPNQANIVINDPMSLPDFPLTSSARSGFFFWGIIDEPVVRSSGSEMKLNPSESHKIISSANLDK